MRRRMMRPLFRVCAVCLKEFLRIFRKDIKPNRKRAKSQNKVKYLPSTAAGNPMPGEQRKTNRAAR
ncbi:hypothetical protein DPMN_132024, partial [Dreissena polymorpha]